MLNNLIIKLTIEKDLQQKQISNLQEVITVTGFNALSVLSEIDLLSKIIENNAKSNLNKYLDDVLNILKLLQNERKDDQVHYLEIQARNNNEILIQQDELDGLRLLKDATEHFYKNNIFQSNQFKDLKKSFKNIDIDIQYLTDSFDSIYSNILKIKETTSNKNIEIGIFITGAKVTDDKFSFNKIIKYMTINIQFCFL